MHEAPSHHIGKPRILLWALSTGILFAVLNLGAIKRFESQELRRTALKDIRAIASFHSGLAATDIILMSAGLDIFAINRDFKTLFRDHDREALYEASKGLFSELTSNHGITHFYFIDKDGTCFLRVHKPKFHSDAITRFTFERAKETQKRAAGIELGKTAYALRVVQPYYLDQELLGYVELGKEIDEFEAITKEELGVEVFLLTSKTELDKEKFREQRRRMGLRDDWDDFDDIVLLSSSQKSDDFELGRFFDTGGISETEDISFLGIAENFTTEGDPKQWIKGAFPFFDGSGRQTGVVLTLEEMASSSAARRFWPTLLAINIALAALSSLAAVFFLR